MDITLPRTSRPKSRQSIAHLPTSSTAVSEKENVTADVSSMQRSRNGGTQVEKRKLRGKSLGRGELEALKETAGNTTKPSASFTPRSILKPTVPLTPPKTIPTFDELRKRNTGKAKSPAEQNGEDLLIDFSTPAPSKSNTLTQVSMTGSEKVVDPFSPMSARKSPRSKSVAVRTEEEQQDAAREREAEERRQAQKKLALEQRAARRKSMANRRVSFAPEATLHTWSVMELAEDSTTSSASNSTRRQSSMTTAQSPLKNVASPGHDSDSTQAPSTPPEQTEEPLVVASPAHQRDENQKKNRGSSAISPRHEKSPTTTSPSSPYSDGSGVMSEDSPMRIEDSIHSDDSDTEDDTAMSMDEATAQSMASEGSGSSTQSSLDERLRRAATQAGTRGIEYDEHGDDLSMEMVTGTITHAFKPWAQAGASEEVVDLSAMRDQENIDSFSPKLKAQAVAREAEGEFGNDTQDMSMDVTSAIGGILPKKASPSKNRRKSVNVSRRRSSVSRRRSSGEQSKMSDETMDLTVAAGGIILPQNSGLEQAEAGNDSTAMSDEDMTMEFTNVVGGMLNSHMRQRRDSTQSMALDDNETMDITAAVGGILEPIEERTEPQSEFEDDRTVPVDMTRAFEHILPQSLTTTDKSRAKQLMEAEADVGQFNDSPRDMETGRVLPFEVTSATPSHVATPVASETGSPSLTLKPRLSGRSKPPTRASNTPKSTPNQSTPQKVPSTLKVATPTKQLTPLPSRGTTPNKTPTIPNVTHRGASPKKLFKAEIKAKSSPAASQKSATKISGIFDRDEQTGQQTPSVVLRAPKPHQHLRRRSSGIGIDREGIGSPRIAELLDRRTSIGEAAPAFIPGRGEKALLHFDDPKQVEQEVDAEHAEEERRESGRFIMEQEADQPEEENATIQLKGMIESMTPKKNKLKGRKSLAVGGARGILGKRPAELDIDDEDDTESTPKRLKAVSRESSPVKKVHLPQPPSASETTGRMTRAKRRSLEDSIVTTTITPTIARSPIKRSAAPSPKDTRRFRDIPVEAGSTRPTSFEDKMDNVMNAVDMSTAQAQEENNDEPENEKISLQDFLNMTNIHFIELSTTKRRHTLAPAAPSRSSQGDQPDSLESCFKAAATTLPLLELYQHATRELKSYISAGRKIIRSIEAETLEEQPLLFREYVDAPPDVRLVMDNQFRNGKTNARLQSKGGWYSWRGQLVDGLRRGLDGIRDGMERDSQQLTKQERVLADVVPGLKARHVQLTDQLLLLEQKEAEMQSVDHEALSESRNQLKAIDQDLAQKMAILEQLQEQMNDKIETLTAAAELKTEMQEQIAEAERVREECRGWSSKDVLALRQRVEVIERETGWKVVAAEESSDEPGAFGSGLTLRYKDELTLFFHPASFRETKQLQRRRSRKSKSVSGPAAPISLIYSSTNGEEAAAGQTLSTEKRFFLQLIRSQLHAFGMMPKGSITTKTVLETVSNGWDVADTVTQEIRFLNMAGVTTVSIQNDEKLSVKVMLMLENRGRVDIEFALLVALGMNGKVAIENPCCAKAVYGDIVAVMTEEKSLKVQQALANTFGEKRPGDGAWLCSVRNFQEWAARQTAAGPPSQTTPRPRKQKQQPPPQNQQDLAEASAPTAPLTASKRLPRSPLATKKTSGVQKKALPVPVTQRREKLASQLQQQRQESMERDKENLKPAGVQGTPEKKLGQPAIPPELQEYMMHTPIKRVGALRRSPLAGV